MSSRRSFSPAAGHRGPPGCRPGPGHPQADRSPGCHQVQRRWCVGGSSLLLLPLLPSLSPLPAEASADSVPLPRAQQATSTTSVPSPHLCSRCSSERASADSSRSFSSLAVALLGEPRALVQRRRSVPLVGPARRPGPEGLWRPRRPQEGAQRGGARHPGLGLGVARVQPDDQEGASSRFELSSAL